MSQYLQLKSKIRDILGNYHKGLYWPRISRELDFVNETTSFFNNKYASYGNTSFFSRSGNIDKSPIVRFFHPTPNQCPATKEVADILFVSKLVRLGHVVRKRAILVQSKFTSLSQAIWTGIDSAQFFLIFGWPDFFRVKPRPISGPYVLKPNSLVWGVYAFVGPKAVNYPIYLSPSTIHRHVRNILLQKTFTLTPKWVSWYQESPSFLMRLILCQIGEDILANSGIGNYVEELYRVVGLSPDPTNEFSWDAEGTDDQPGGFGIVEFTTSINEE